VTRGAAPPLLSDRFSNGSTCKRPGRDFPVATLLDALAQFLGESFYLAHGHDAYALTGKESFHKNMPRISSVRRCVGKGRDFREPVARVNAAGGVSQSLRLRQIAPQGNRLDQSAHAVLVAVVQRMGSPGCVNPSTRTQCSGLPSMGCHRNTSFSLLRI
jgi:hypothetical protein